MPLPLPVQCRTTPRSGRTRPAPSCFPPRSAPLRSRTVSLLESRTSSLPIDGRPRRCFAVPRSPPPLPLPPRAGVERLLEAVERAPIPPASPRSAPLRSGTFSLPKSETSSLPIDGEAGGDALSPPSPSPRRGPSSAAVSVPNDSSKRSNAPRRPHRRSPPVVLPPSFSPVAARRASRLAASVLPPLGRAAALPRKPAVTTEPSLPAMPLPPRPAADAAPGAGHATVHLPPTASGSSPGPPRSGAGHFSLPMDTPPSFRPRRTPAATLRPRSDTIPAGPVRLGRRRPGAPCCPRPVAAAGGGLLR